MPSGVSETPLTPGGNLWDRDVRDLLDYAPEFRLTREQAIQRLQLVAEAISHWREDALGLGAETDSLGYMDRAFEGENAKRVGSLEPAPLVIDLAGAGSPAPPATNSQGEVWVTEHSRRGKVVRGHFRKRRG
jgi:serine/threonine-protein kinase HipA